VRCWPLTNSFFFLGILTSVRFLVKIDQEMRPWECSQTDRYTDRLTDANRFLANVNYMSSSVRLSFVCNVRAPYSRDWNFRQCFYAIWYPVHMWPFGKNFTEIMPGEPLPPVGGVKHKGVGLVENRNFCTLSWQYKWERPCGNCTTIFSIRKPYYNVKQYLRCGLVASGVDVGSHMSLCFPWKSDQLRCSI